MSRDKEKEATTSESPGKTEIGSQNEGNVSNPSSGITMAPARVGMFCHNAMAPPAKAPCYRFVHVLSGEPCHFLQVPFFGATPYHFTCPATAELLSNIMEIWRDPDDALKMEGVEVISMERMMRLEVKIAKKKREGSGWSPNRIDQQEVIEMIDDLNVERVSNASQTTNAEAAIATLLNKAVKEQAEAERAPRERAVSFTPKLSRMGIKQKHKGQLLAKFGMNGLALSSSSGSPASSSTSGTPAALKLNMNQKQDNAPSIPLSDVVPIPQMSLYSTDPRGDYVNRQRPQVAATSGALAMLKSLQKTSDSRTPDSSSFGGTSHATKQSSTPVQVPSSKQQQKAPTTSASNKPQNSSGSAMNRNHMSGATLSKPSPKLPTPASTSTSSAKNTPAQLSSPGFKTPTTAHSSGGTPAKTSSAAKTTAPGSIDAPAKPTKVEAPAITPSLEKTPTTGVQSTGVTSAKSSRKTMTPASVKSTPTSKIPPTQQSMTPSRVVKEEEPEDSYDSKMNDGSCKSLTPASNAQSPSDQKQDFKVPVSPASGVRSTPTTSSSSQAKGAGKAGRPKKKKKYFAGTPPTPKATPQQVEELEDTKPDVEELKLKIQKKRPRVSEAQKLWSMDFGPKEGGRLADIDAGLGVTRRRTLVNEPPPEPPKARLRSPSCRKATNRTGFKEADTSEEEDEEEDVEEDDDDADEDYVEPGAKKQKLDERNSKARLSVREALKSNVAQIAESLRKAKESAMNAAVGSKKTAVKSKSSTSGVQPKMPSSRTNSGPIHQPTINRQNNMLHQLDSPVFSGYSLRKLVTIDGQLGFYEDNKFKPVMVSDKTVPQELLSQLNASLNRAPPPPPPPQESPKEMTIRQFLQPRSIEELSRHKLFKLVLDELKDCYPNADFRKIRYGALRRARRLARQIVRSKRFHCSPPKRSKSTSAMAQILLEQQQNAVGRKSRSHRRHSAPPIEARYREDSLLSRSRSRFSDFHSEERSPPKRTPLQTVNSTKEKLSKASDDASRRGMWEEFTNEMSVSQQQKELESRLKQIRQDEKAKAGKKVEILAQLNGTPIKMMPMEVIRQLTGKSAQHNGTAQQKRRKDRSPTDKRKKSKIDVLDTSLEAREKRESYMNEAIESVVNGTANHNLLVEPNLPRSLVTQPVHSLSIQQGVPPDGLPSSDGPSTSGPPPAHQFSHLTPRQIQYLQHQQLIQKQQMQHNQQQHYAGTMNHPQQQHPRKNPPSRPYRPKKETPRQEQERREWIAQHYEKERQLQIRKQQLQHQQKQHHLRSSAAPFHSSSSASPAPILEANSPMRTDESDEIIEVPYLSKMVPIAPNLAPCVSKLVPIVPTMSTPIAPICIPSINMRSPPSNDPTPVRLVPVPQAPESHLLSGARSAPIQSAERLAQKPPTVPTPSVPMQSPVNAISMPNPLSPPTQQKELQEVLSQDPPANTVSTSGGRVPTPATPVSSVVVPKEPLASSQSSARSTPVSSPAQPAALLHAPTAVAAPLQGDDVRNSMIRASIPPGNLPVKPEQYEVLYAADSELFLPPNKTADYRTWKTSDLLVWLENFCPSSEHSAVHEKIKEEEIDGFFIADAAMSNLRKELGIAFGPWRKIQTHAAAVINQYRAEKYAILMADYANKLKQLNSKEITPE